ncbi:23665_t:CDS:2 [Dentiscutata erythropus]|uniref:23665_t:CDS:1 n=1 Tax=Dentiscutata erythropus TaxID=1348616 RepID=A0A9N9DT29_9GLOM|nr:23665_t:CDS:2 [Dentiscutata erythropus]
MCIAWISKLSKIFKKKLQPEVTNNDVDEIPDLERFAERLELRRFTENKNFAGTNFVWPSTIDVYEHNLVFYYIIDPKWYPDGDKLTTNTIAYRCLIEFKSLDPSKGTHILLIYGKISKYGNDISSEEYEKFREEYPGYLYTHC